MDNKKEVEEKNQVPVEDSAALGKRIIEEKEQKDVDKAAAEVKLAERLMRAVVNDSVEVTLHDADGEFKLRCRRFTWSEQDQLLEFNKELQSSTLNMEDKAVRAKVNLQFFRLLAYPTGVCLNKELDLEFWKKGDYSTELPKQILSAVRNQSDASVAAARSFRKQK